MAEPIVSAPRPWWLQRVGRFLTGAGTEAPEAQPVGINPIETASPAEEGAPPPVGKRAYTRAYGGFSIDPRWLEQLALNDDKVLKREGSAQDLRIYEAVLDDPACASAFQQRRLAVVSKNWEVEPGDDSARAKQAADHLRDQLAAIAWDRICDRMLYGLWFGYAVGEAMFDYGPDGKVWLKDVLVPDRKWFGFTNGGELRLRSAENVQESLPPNKFWAYRCGATHDFAPYGMGLAHWCYWPVWFKKNAIKFWAIYLEKFGMPTALGKFPIGATDDTKSNLLEAAAAVGRDAAVTIPDDTELELMASGRTSDATYEQFCAKMDDEVFRIILSQTGTSKSEAQGLGGSQSDVMKDVRDEVVAADSDTLHESFNKTIATWLTEWNFGKDCPVPRVYRNLEPEEDLAALAETDAAIEKLGWQRTEESFRETYGEGYERKPEPAQGKTDPLTGLPYDKPAPPPGSNVIDINQERAKRAAQFAAFASNGPRPLYVSRKLEAGSARQLLAWAAQQGIPDLEPAAELHVTVLFSRQPVDWFDMGSDWQSDPAGRLRVPPGGPRSIVRLGENCIVLRFANNDLKWRHDSMVEKGASHDYEDYAPHVTIAKNPDFDVDAIQEAFQGELVFGPEIFEPLQLDDGLEPELEMAFSADQLDAIDRWAAKLANESEPLIAEFAASLKGRLDGITTPDALRVVLLEALEKFPAERLGELAGLAFTASRAAATAGESDQLAV